MEESTNTNVQQTPAKKVIPTKGKYLFHRVAVREFVRRENSMFWRSMTEDFDLPTLAHSLDVGLKTMEKWYAQYKENVVSVEPIEDYPDIETKHLPRKKLRRLGRHKSKLPGTSTSTPTPASESDEQFAKRFESNFHKFLAEYNRHKENSKFWKDMAARINDTIEQKLREK